jgi:iron(III) transport system substrate-binding protein
MAKDIPQNSDARREHEVIRPRTKIGLGWPSFFALGLSIVPEAVGALSIDEIAHLSAPDRQQTLERGAKQEGVLILYTSLIVDQAVRPLEQAFEAKYPFIDLQYTRADSTQITQRLFAEARAGRGKADVVIASTSAALKQAKLLQPFQSPALAVYPKNYIQADNLWATVRFSYNGIAYNTKKVSREQAPKTWDDLLDPKWKGRMVWGKSLETGGPLVINSFLLERGKEQTEKYFAKLAEQDVAVASGSIRAILDQVIAGEYDVMISAALHHVMISHRKGAPVWFASVDPVIARPEHVQLLKSAPHPHAAMLLIDYLLSEEGQTILKEAGYVPAHPKVDPPEDLRPTVPALNNRRQIVITPADALEMQDSTMEIFKRTSRSRIRRRTGASFPRHD